MSAPLSALFEHNSGRFSVEAARYGSVDLATSSIYSFLAELPIRGNFWHPKAGETVFDVGAAFGAYTLPALVDGARVFAFEPDPALYQALTANVARNVQNGESNTWIPGWRFGALESALSLKSGQLAYDAEPGVTFQATTIDEFLTAFPGAPKTLDWIKSDTEGHEAHVLLGGEDAIRNFRPNILLESHRFRRQTETRDLQELLHYLGYVDSQVQVFEAGIVDYIFARRP